VGRCRARSSSGRSACSRAYWGQFIPFLDYGIEIRRLLWSVDERPAAQCHPQLRPVPFRTGRPQGPLSRRTTWPNIAPTSGSAVPGGNRRCRRSRSTSRDESQSMTVAMITYPAGRTLPRAAPREEIPVASEGDQPVIVVGGRRKRSGFQFCVPAGFGHGPAGGAAGLAAVAGRC
jgi:hypothetical protein